MKPPIPLAVALALLGPIGASRADEAASGRAVYVPRKDLDYAVSVGLRMLTLRRLVEERDGLFTARPSEMHVLRYYANSIAHLLD